MSLNDELLPPRERIAILTERIKNLKAGSGDYDRQRTRDRAIVNAEQALKDAQKELRGQS